MKNQNKVLRGLLQISIWIVLTMNVGFMAYGQSQISFAGMVDGTLLFFGDEEHGMDAGTLNMVIKSKWQGNQGKWGYVHVAPVFEYAQLTIEEYYRYSGEVGYTFNQFWLEGLEMGIYVDYGFIDRGLTTFSYGFGGQVAYKITNTIKGVASLQFVDRTDLITIYGMPSEIRYSVHVGVEIAVFKRKVKATRF